MTQYRYIRGSRDSRETVEFDLHRRGRYVTTVVVDVDMLICGIKTFPCSNGNSFKLTRELRMEVLEHVKRERKTITDRYPVKTRKGWEESGLRAFEDYCFPGDKVDEEMVEYFVDSVPPTLLRSSCTQAGEAHNDELDERTGKHRDTYTTFHKVGKGQWAFDGYCFYGENINRCSRKSRLEERLNETRKEARYK